jgi:hypothetical protein
MAFGRSLQKKRDPDFQLGFVWHGSTAKWWVTKSDGLILQHEHLRALGGLLGFLDGPVTALPRRSVVSAL